MTESLRPSQFEIGSESEEHNISEQQIKEIAEDNRKRESLQKNIMIGLAVGLGLFFTIL